MFRKTTVVIVDAGTGGKALLEIFASDSSVQVLGVVDINASAPGINIPTSTEYKEFIRNPEVDLIVDVTGNSEVHEDIRRLKHAHAELIGGVSAKFIWALVDEHKQKELLEEKYGLVLREFERQFKDELVMGNNPKMKEIADLIIKVAPSPTTVLICGETGTGKEVIARAIHRHSHLRDRPLITVNCTAFSPNLIESELFGYKKGAFTGATSDRVGLLEKAHQGTIFLDEIGDMSLEMQAKLLRFLQTGEIRAVGDVRTKKVETRIIAATNRNLEEAIAKGQFRADLFYRFNSFTIHLPPLRDRLEDLPLLAYHFLKQAVAKVNKKVNKISPEAINYLMSYSWPGNLRELQSVIERAVVLCTGNQIEKEHLPLILKDEPVNDSLDDGLMAAKNRIINQFERQAICKYLSESGGNVTLAAQKAKIPRRTLQRLMVKHGISSRDFK